MFYLYKIVTFLKTNLLTALLYDLWAQPIMGIHRYTARPEKKWLAVLRGNKKMKMIMVVK